jgi:hypothetical protein
MRHPSCSSCWPTSHPPGGFAPQAREKEIRWHGKTVVSGSKKLEYFLFLPMDGMGNIPVLNA